MSQPPDIFQIETEIVSVLKNVYDPEIPVNIYDLGLIYEISLNDEQVAEITMTLTAPNCQIGRASCRERVLVKV